MHKDEEFYAIDAHSHLGRRKTPLGHGVASFLGDDLVRNLDGYDERDLLRAIAQTIRCLK